MNAVWHWIVAQDIPGAILKWGLLALLGWLVTLARRHVKQQKETNDLLRTDTPGGLADIRDALDGQKPRAHSLPGSRPKGEGRG